MSVIMKLRGTTVPFFTVGNHGVTLFQGAQDPVGEYSAKNGDVWFDTTASQIKMRVAGAWSPYTSGVIPISQGGTGQATANAGLNALLPSQTGQTGKVLSTDGANTSWISASGTGTVTDVSVVTANGVSGTVANSTTTPAITLTLGAITPTSVNTSGTVTAATFSGSGSALTGLNASNLASGTVPTARQGSGTADSTTFLRGDQTWATPPDQTTLTASGPLAPSAAQNAVQVGVSTNDTGPFITMTNTGSAVNNRSWYMTTRSTGNIDFGLSNDAYSQNAEFLSVARSGQTATNITLTGTAITLSGAVTGTSFSGTGTGLTSLNASNLSTGTVNTARLGSGTANNTTFLRGDGTWQTLSSLDASTLTGTTLASNVVNSSLTSVGTLGSLTVSGAASAASFTGSGASLTSLNASNISTGTVGTARLGSGSATSSTFLRGDGTWSAVPNPTTIQATGALTFSSVLGNAGIFGGTRINSTGPTSLYFNQTTSNGDSRAWRMQTLDNGSGDGIFVFQTVSDLDNAATNVLSFTRSGLTPGLTTLATPLTVTGAVTGSSFTGSGSGLTTLNADNITTGTVGTARLGTGTANASTYLRGDGTWQNPTPLALAGTSSITIAGGATGAYVGRNNANALPMFGLINTAASANNRTSTWQSYSTGQIAFNLSNDGQTASSDIILISRSGNTATDVTINSNTMTLNSAVTATSFAGDGANLTALNASNISTGTVSTARLGSGTANNTTFLRGDGTWQATGGGTVTSVDVSGGTTGLTTSGGPITSSGTITLSGTLAIANGGTGQTNAASAINALLPSQTGNSGNYLTTNGTVASWATPSIAALNGTGVTTRSATVTGAYAGNQGGDQPFISFIRAPATTGNRITTIWVDDAANTFRMTLDNDNYSVTNNFFAVTRSGQTATNITLTGTAITLTGAVTGTSFSGTGTGLTALNASNLSSGTVGTARLGSGTANNTTFLRGDGTWAVPTATVDASTLTGTTLASNVVTASLTTITPVASGPSVAGTDLVLNGGAAGGGGLSVGGGNVLITAGTAAGAAAGGSVTIAGATSPSVTGGSVNISGGVCGNTTGVAGAVNITGGNISGNGASVTPGAVNITGGSTGTGNVPSGGNVTLTGGGNASTTNPAGNTVLRGGLNSAAGGGGSVVVSTGNSSHTERLRITASGEWKLATVAGTSGQVLTSNGTGAAPTWQTPTQTSPGGSTTQVQFNNAGAFAGDANFTFDSGTDTLTVTNIAGAGAAITALNASNLATGTVGSARLGTGTADNTTYLRGDGTWSTVTAGSADASLLTGTTLAANVVSSSLTSVGTLSSLTVSGMTSFNGVGGMYSTTLTTAATTANQVLDQTLAIAAYRAVKYIVTVTSGSSYHYTEIAVMHDGTNVFMTENGTMMTGSSLATFTAAIVSGNLQLQTTPANAVTFYNVVATAIAV